VGAGVERRQLVVVDLAGEDHAGQLARPLARRADQHERQLARRLDQRIDTPVRVGVAEVADPQQVVLRDAVVHAHGRDLRRRARGEGGRGRLGDHVDALGGDAQVLRGVGGDRVGGDDQPRRPREREVAHAAAQPCPQVLAGPLLLHEVVDRDDHRHARAQQCPGHPRGVEEVVLAARLAALDDLAATPARLLQQAVQQAARVAPDPAPVGGGAGIEADAHHGPVPAKASLMRA